MTGADLRTLYTVLTTHPAEIVVIRHAESEKNLRAIHGGAGEPLTPEGRRSIHQLMRNRELESIYGSRILASPAVQIVQTASAFASLLGSQIVIDERLRGIDMGVLTGQHSDDQSAETQDLVGRWACGRLPISGLHVSGMEAPDAFARRIAEGLTSHLSTSAAPCLWVGSRSTMILMWNILKFRGRLSWNSYFARQFGNLEYLRVGGQGDSQS